MILPTIEGREALPVRLLHYITNGNIGPVSIALLLAEKRGIRWHRSLEKRDKINAYRRLSDGTVLSMQKGEWETPLFSIQSLTERYDKQDKHYDEWVIHERFYVAKTINAAKAT